MEPRRDIFLEVAKWTVVSVWFALVVLFFVVVYDVLKERRERKRRDKQ